MTTIDNQQLALLKKHFANCFDKNGNFIPAKLQEIVQDSGVTLSKESYSLNWLGKSYARLLANENIRTRLVADATHNAKASNATSQNLLIKGDNLEVLKHLRGAYSEQVKMIYIDPPYNTGSDGFVYEDDRKFTAEQLSGLAGISEDEAKRTLEFTSSKSNSHSAWLTFMYPRLYIAKQLLRDDGVIFISIDDNEQAQLKILCDEVLGEENFIANIVWHNSSRHSEQVSSEHEYILLYAKSHKATDIAWTKSRELANLLNQLVEELKESGVSLKDAESILATKIDEMIKAGKELGNNDYSWLVNYKNLDEEWRIFYAVDLSGEGDGPPRFFNGKKVPAPTGRHWMGQDYIDELESEKRIVFRNERAYRKLYIEESLENIKSIIRLPTRNGSEEIKQLLGKDIFSKPKPSNLIKKICSFLTKNDDIILDFFAGSGTTAHAVMQLNADDNYNRQFICVQIDEATDPKKEAFKAGYKTIFDITKARITKASAKIQAEHPDYRGDLGFKVFEIQLMFEKYLEAPAELMENLELFDVNALSQQDRHSLMLTWGLRDGIRLGVALTPVNLESYTAYSADKTLYFIEPNISLTALVALLDRLDNDPDFSPSRLVMLGYLLDSKSQREITEAVKHYNNRKGIELTLDIRYN